MAYYFYINSEVLIQSHKFKFMNNFLLTNLLALLLSSALFGQVNDKDERAVIDVDCIDITKVEGDIASGFK